MSTTHATDAPPQDTGRRQLDSAVSVPEPEHLALPVAHHRSSLGALVGIVILFSLGAAVGMSSITGFDEIVDRLRRFDSIWITASVAGVVAAFMGYRLAFDSVVWGKERDRLTQVQRTGVVAAGFGAFIYRGGTAIDRYVMRATGHDRRETDVRLAALQMLEMVPIALAATIAAYIELFTDQGGRPPLDFDLPWAVGSVIGVLVVLWFAKRYRHRWEDADRGWRYWLGVAVSGLWHLCSILARGPGRAGAVLGMCVFAFGEMLAVWAAMAAFGYRMSIAGVILGYGVGYIISRRSAPLGGAGFIDVLLIVALSQAGAPLSAAIVGTFTYRFFNLWCSMPASLAALASIRRFAGGRRSRSVS